MRLLNHQFNLTDDFQGLIAPVSPKKERDIFQSIQSGANSLLGVAATKVSGAASQVESAVGSAATFAQDLEDRIPQNCSIGTKKVCVSTKHNVTCAHLPFDLSRIMPDPIKDLPIGLEHAIQERIRALSPIPKTLNRITHFTVQGLLLTWLIPTSFISILSCLLVANWPIQINSLTHRMQTSFKGMIIIATGIIFCSPLAFLVIVISVVIQKAAMLPSWVELEKGEVTALCYGCMGCAVAIIVLSASAPAVGQLRSGI